MKVRKSCVDGAVVKAMGDGDEKLFSKVQTVYIGYLRRHRKNKDPNSLSTVIDNF